MNEENALLFANEAFYRAFADRNVKAMGEVWADDAPVACIHPGWTPLVGLESVLASWQGILGNPSSPAIECHTVRAFVQGDAGFVICFEQIGEHVLVATNVFVRRGSMWRMVHHQAGPTAVETEAPPPSATGPLN